MTGRTRDVESKTTQMPKVFMTLACVIVAISTLACGGTVESTSSEAMNRGRGGSSGSPFDTPPGSGSVTGRKVRSADLAQITFQIEFPRIAGPIELCLTSALRNRQWNVAAHPFRVDLGGPSFPNVERLVKAIFSNVRVTLNAPCGQAGDMPSIEVLIRSPNRDPYSKTISEMQRTAVTLAVVLSASDGHEIWSYAYEAESKAKPIPQASALVDRIFLNRLIRTSDAFSGLRPERHRHAAREFGIALDLGLREIHRALRESAEVRTFFAPTRATAAPQKRDSPDA